MNKTANLLMLFGIVTISSISSYSAYASPTWNSFCSTVTTSKSSINPNSLEATNYTVQASNNPAIKMIAQQMTATKSNNLISTDQFQRITNITSTGILNLILSHQMKECSKSYYINSLTPLMDSVKKGDKVNFTWNNVVIQNSKVTYKMKTLSTQISGQGNNLHIIIHFSGLSTSSTGKTPAALIPQQGNIDLTTTEQAYPLILAATSGTNTQSVNTAIPVTINQLDIRNTQTAIIANGKVTLNNKPTLTSANGVVKIKNMQALINASDQSKNSKLKTGLILAKFAGRSAGDNTLEWNINWQGNLFKVNSVPIPVW